MPDRSCGELGTLLVSRHLRKKICAPVLCMTNSLLSGRIKNNRNRRRRTLPALCTALLFGAFSGAPAALAQAPQLFSVTPPNGTTNAPVNSSLVFVFDQPMDTDVSVTPSFPPFLVGNLE